MRRLKSDTGEVELDLGRYELRRSGRVVRIEKKPMDLLIFLVERRDQLVSRKDIVTKLWRSDLFVDTERNINNIVRKIRTALRDDSPKPRFLETVVGKGYRFVGPVRVIHPRHGTSEASTRWAADGSGENSGRWEECVSLAVLPLVFLGSATDERGLGLGFADALVTRLGNLQGVDVLPTSAVLNVPQARATDVASRLGVRFLVHGAVQVSKGQARISLEVFDGYSASACFTRKHDLDLNRLSEFESEVARQIAGALNRPAPAPVPHRPRHSRDGGAYAEFMRGYALSLSGERARLDEAVQHLTNAVLRDPAFALAHADLSLLYATRHFESDPVSVWLEKAEFHLGRALELDPELPEAHVTRAFLLWGPSKNFQHLDAIAALKRALRLQKNLPHAYNRLGTILAHIGLLDRAREMYVKGRLFNPKRAMSHSILQVHMWSRDYERAREEIQAWREDSPTSKYALYFAPQPAMMTGEWDEARALLDEALRLVPEDPIIVSLQGLYYALIGKREQALECLGKACANPKSFGHAHHTSYQIACILAILGQKESGLEWLERSVGTGFACWPFFLSDPCLENLRGLPAFEVLVNSLQGKYSDALGVL